MGYKKEVYGQLSFSGQLGLKSVSLVCDIVRLAYQKSQSSRVLWLWLWCEKKWQSLAGFIQFMPYVNWQEVEGMGGQKLAASFAECMKIARHEEGEEIKLGDL